MIINNIFIRPIITFVIFRICPNISAFLLLIFNAFFCGFSRFFVVCRVLVRVAGFRFLWAYFMPVSVRVARDIFREREERKEKSAPPLWWCALAFALVSLIGNGL